MADDLQALVGNRVLITGATGFIGGHLARRLLDAGVELRVLVRDADRARHLQRMGAELWVGDLREPLGPVTEDIDIVVHAAAWVGAGGDPAAARAVNVHGTRSILALARMAGVRRTVHVSSCAVYGSPQREGIDEQAPLCRRGFVYHDTKVDADQLALAFAATGDPIVVARPALVYGPGSQVFTVAPLEAIRSGWAVLIDGGRHRCKVVYIDDVVDGLIACMCAPGIEGEAFNICAPPITWRDLLEGYAGMLDGRALRSVPRQVAWTLVFAGELLGRLRGRAPPIRREIVAGLTSDGSYSAAKAAARLGWRARVDLAEGLRRTEPWLREQGLLQLD